MAYTQADLDLVNRHVADGARCVAQIEKSIAHAVTMALMIDHQGSIAASLGLSKTPDIPD